MDDTEILSKLGILRLPERIILTYGQALVSGRSLMLISDEFALYLNVLTLSNSNLEPVYQPKQSLLDSNSENTSYKR